jgi:tetratricopeptide (TPR) repeat protein
MTIKVSFNGTEVMTKDFAVGETPAVEWNPPPKTSGVVQTMMIIGDKEIPSGSATYWAPDFKGAQMLVDEAKKLTKANKRWQARTKLLAAVKLFEKLAPNSDDLARAYCFLWGITFFAKARPSNLARRQKEALEWYEKEIAIYERRANVAELGSSLTNISVMYARAGDRDTALKRALRGLEIARIRNDKDDPEAIHAWTQTIWHLLALSRLHEAESLIAEGLARFSENPLRAYLLHQQAHVYTERAKLCQQLAEQLLPPDSCPL